MMMTWWRWLDDDDNDEDDGDDEDDDDDDDGGGCGNTSVLFIAKFWLVSLLVIFLPTVSDDVSDGNVYEIITPP